VWRRESETIAPDASATVLKGEEGGGVSLPTEVKTKDEFEKVLEKARQVRVLKSGANAKVKVRTDKMLYTFKTSSDEADTLVKGVKAEVLELDAGDKAEKDKES
jgi:Ribosomal L38e protein family